MGATLNLWVCRWRIGGVPGSASTIGITVYEASNIIYQGNVAFTIASTPEPQTHEMGTHRAGVNTKRPQVARMAGLERNRSKAHPFAPDGVEWMNFGIELLEALPVAVYTTDAEGRITFYNEAAAALWGYRPQVGDDRWCGSWRLYFPDGRPLPHDECPMAVALKDGRPLRDQEAVAERPDGTRVPFLAYPTPLRDASGRVTGAINLLVDVTGRAEADIQDARLAAIVAFSDDAIISKTLEGKITSWNAGATRIFGWEASEMIGASITRIIPPELRAEEEMVLGRLRRGERLEHYETVRVTKDGRRVDISLTVSPLRSRAGVVVGASKIARDVTERKRAEEMQRLLVDELNHRVKNTLAMVQAIAAQSMRSAQSPGTFVSSFNGRVQAMARAHDLLIQTKLQGAEVTEIVREQVLLGGGEAGRVSCSGPLLLLDPQGAVQLSLVLHELATNARKYGALSVPAGRVSISWEVQTGRGRVLFLRWQESGGPQVSAPTSRGFGTTLLERTLHGHGGEGSIRYAADGVVCEMRLPLPEGDRSVMTSRSEPGWGGRKADARGQEETDSALEGKRILVVEDEPLVSMEIEALLTAAGFEVIGPVGKLDVAQQIVADLPCDAALVDANLGGSPVDALVAALTRGGIPFAFATGYGREGLPRGFQDAPLLIKPFSSDQLLATIRTLLAKAPESDTVVPLKQKKV
jgi:PAS domain S-box-containing protein